MNVKLTWKFMIDHKAVSKIKRTSISVFKFLKSVRDFTVREKNEMGEAEIIGDL